MEKLASFGTLPAAQRKTRPGCEELGDRRGRRRRCPPTVGAKDVGEDGPQVLVVRQLVDHLRQAAGGHFEEEGQTSGQARGHQDLGQGGGADLQQSQGPNAPAGFLEKENTP